MGSTELLWRDFVRYLCECELYVAQEAADAAAAAPAAADARQRRRLFAENNGVAVQVVALGCASAAAGARAAGRVCQCDLVMEDLRQHLRRRPRVACRAVDCLCYVISEEAQQEEQQGVFFCAFALQNLYNAFEQAEPGTGVVYNPLFMLYREKVMPLFRQQALKLVNAGGSGSSCQVFLSLTERLEAAYSSTATLFADLKPSGDELALFYRTALSAACSDPERTYVFYYELRFRGWPEEHVRAARQFLQCVWSRVTPTAEEMCRLLDSLLRCDVSASGGTFSALSCLPLLWEKTEAGSCGSAAGGLWQRSFLELCWVCLAEGGRISGFADSLAAITAAALDTLSQAPDEFRRKEMPKVVCALLTALTSAVEADVDWRWLCDTAVPAAVSLGDSAAPAPPETAHALRYLAEALQGYHPERCFGAPDDAMRAFSRDFGGAGSDFSPEQQRRVLRAVLRLGSLLMRRRLDAECFAHFLAHEFPPSYALPRGWCGGNAADLTECVLALLEIGRVEIFRGANYVKALRFNFAPVFEQLSRTGAPQGDCAAMLRTILAKARWLQQQQRTGQQHAPLPSLEVFLVYVVPLALQLSRGGGGAPFAEVVDLLVTRFESNGRTMNLHFAYQLLSSSFPDCAPRIAATFLALLQRYRRTEARALCELAMFPCAVTQPYMAPLVRCAFGAQWPLASHTKRANLLELLRQLALVIGAHLREPLIIVGDYEARPPPLAEQQQPSSAEDVTKERAAKANAVGLVLVQDICAALERHLAAGRVDKHVARDTEDGLTTLSLFRSIFFDELVALHGRDANYIRGALKGQLPLEVLHDPKMLDLLLLIARRIDHVLQSCPKFSHVAELSASLVRDFLQVRIPPEVPPEEHVLYRRKFLDNKVFELPQNVELRQHLVANGYSESLWQRYTDAKDGGLEVLIELEAHMNIEKNLMTALTGLFGEYLDILESLGVKELQVPNAVTSEKQAVPVARLFMHGDAMTHDELISRRILAVNALDAVATTSGRDNAAYLRSKKQALLAREDKLEADAEHQRQLQNQQDASACNGKAAYRVRLLTAFLQTCACCGRAIVGCYAPDGDHAEKPLENALKANCAFASLGLAQGSSPSYTAYSPEMENVELVFTDQGMLVYKLYTNGHSCDTSLAWVAFLRSVMAASLVPGVIVPRGYPDPQTFSFLAEHIRPQTTTTVLTMKDSFFSEYGVASYYDAPGGVRPEKINIGDIYITPKNYMKLPTRKGTLRTSQSRLFVPGSPPTVAAASIQADQQLSQLPPSPPSPPSQQPVAQRPELLKDLAGTIRRDAIQLLRRDPAFAPYLPTLKAFGRHLGTFVNEYLDTGALHESVLRDGFSVEVWNAQGTTALAMSEEGKDAAVRRLSAAVRAAAARYYSVDALPGLLVRSRRLFLELYARLDHAAHVPDTPTADVPLSAAGRRALLLECRRLLLRSVRLVSVDTLPTALQPRLMRWVFGTEDRVWRARGGLPADETVGFYVGLLRPGSYAGTVALVADPQCTPFDEAVIGYAVGEYVAPDRERYEVVTAWVSDAYRSLGVATALYTHVLEAVGAQGCRNIACDLLLGSYQRWGNAQGTTAGPIARVVAWAMDWVGHYALAEAQAPSYAVEVGADATAREEFGRTVFDVRRTRLLLHLRQWAARALGVVRWFRRCCCRRWPLALALALVAARWLRPAVRCAGGVCVL
eukprot:TRINITY_DN194_c5_g1_i1.p1 TRINITY_DN194_c5_g1~~TRINITY_DN194_c5_g1_i1.p1  ORF type:complete len:1733 (+),score=377.66 TRINITY_DN194_c5_g1_i1:121-5199(+)